MVISVIFVSCLVSLQNIFFFCACAWQRLCFKCMSHSNLFVGLFQVFGFQCFIKSQIWRLFFRQKFFFFKRLLLSYYIVTLILIIKTYLTFKVTNKMKVKTTEEILYTSDLVYNGDLRLFRWWWSTNIQKDSAKRRLWNIWWKKKAEKNKNRLMRSHASHSEQEIISHQILCGTTCIL